ncbi:MAG: 3-phosphoshikimate 1-carboxyvinyltransferase [Clostridia bacterium]|nr:3-phosphoshikimate 1-carboxyvinyltransferase [Clostridia bacterium]
MDIKLTPSALKGDVYSIASKSDVHRLMICALLSGGAVRINGVSRCADTDATAACITALGAQVDFSGRVCTVTPPASVPKTAALDCGESGSTLRFLLPVAARLCERASFTGSGRLPMRPIGELADAMQANGTQFSNPTLPFTVSGGLRAGTYRLPGNVSSQYVSGLLMALSALAGESRIELTTPLQSGSYVNMTLHTLSDFGARVQKSDNGYIIYGVGKLSSPVTVTADGDWSNAAFFLAAGALGEGVTVKGLNTESVQGDKKVLDALQKFGAAIKCEGDEITVTRGTLHGCTVDLTDTPDLLPILAVVAAFAEGSTAFTGGARLRLKESDRLETTRAMIEALGGKAEVLPDGIIVHGTGLQGGKVDGANDHRIVMAAAIGGCFAKGDTAILGAQAVDKSYPDFFTDLAGLGGNSYVI